MPKKHVRLVAHVTDSLARAIKHEAIDRNMTIGELIEEAYNSRVVYLSRPSTPTPSEGNPK